MTSPDPALVTNGALLTVRYSVAGQEAQNVLGLQWEAITPPTQAMATEVLNAWWTPIKATLPSAVSCLGATLRDLRVPDGLAVDVGAPAAAVGTDSGTLTVAAAGAVIHWRSTQGGRSGRGRTFLPGLGEADVDTNGRTLASAMVTRVQAAVASYLSTMGTATAPLTPAVVSRRLGQAAPITSGSVASTVGIQRRRMR